MARKPRVEYAEGIFHVIQRGNNREYIFNEADEKDYLIDCFQRAVEKDKAEIFAYVVMGNHFHAAMKSENESLGKVMQRINTRYSVYYNRKRERTGHVFEGRYKAAPVQDDRYLLALVRYIHRNPVRAKICDRVENYRWSSDGYYRGICDSFVCSDLLLGILANDSRVALDEYHNLMKITDEHQDMMIREADYIGDEALCAQWTSQELDPARSELDEILINTGLDMEGYRMVKNGSRKRELVPYKEAFVRRALAEGYPQNEIASFLGLTRMTLYRYIKN
ncbi:MAG: transposase [Bacillota bacterium]|nr:transposase [Bacillota bacterium]